MLVSRHQEKWIRTVDNSELIVTSTESQNQNIYEFAHQYPKYAMALTHIAYELAQKSKLSKLQIVDTKEKLEQVLDLASQSQYLLIDTYSEYRTSYKGYISYLLLGAKNTGYLIDAANLHDEMDRIKYVLEKKEVVKFCMRSANVLNDLKRDFHIFSCNMMDLEIIERSIQIKTKALSYEGGDENLRKLLKYHKRALIDRPINKILLQVIQQKFDQMTKCLSRLYEYLLKEDPQCRLYAYCNYYEALLFPYRHIVLSQKDEDNALILQRTMMHAQLDKENKENPNISMHLLNSSSEEEEQRHQFQKNKYEKQLCDRLLEWRDHMAKIQDASAEEEVPYVIIVEIIKTKAKSVLQLSQIFSQFSDALLDIEKYEKILEVIELHQEEIENYENSIEIKKNYKKEDKKIRALLQELSWSNTQEWLNRKNDQSIKLYKEIISIDILEDSIVEQYINEMDQKGGLQRAQISKYVKYADCFKNGNHKKLQQIYQLSYRKPESQNLEKIELKSEQFIDKGEESEDSENFKSQTSTSSLEEALTEGLKTPYSLKSTNTLPSELDLRLQIQQQKQKQKLINKIRPLPENIEEIYRKAVTVKKNYNKTQKKKKEKKESKGKIVDNTQDFIPTMEDLINIL